jgi:acyl-CoA synthetase (AMP-forming)/AMP-acid ligase II
MRLEFIFTRESTYRFKIIILRALPVIPYLIRAVAATNGNRVALVVDGAGRITYRELYERASAISAGLHARGIRTGDLVALLFPTAAWLDYACALLAVQKIGAVAVVVSDGATDDELRHIAQHCDLRAILTDRPRELPDVAGWQSDLAAIEVTARPGSPLAETPMAEVQPSDLAMVLHTSGTTGRPKGVPITHAQFAVPALEWVAPKARWLPADRVISPFPIASAAGQLSFVKEMGRANTLYLMPKFDADRFCALVAGERIQEVQLGPAMGHWLARSGKHKTTTLTTPLSVAFSTAPFPVAVIGEMRALFPNAELRNVYTSTELAPALVATAVDPARPTAVGKPLAPAELRITRETGATLPAGEHGEVRIRVPGLSGRRYLGDEAASARAFDGDWVCTGDIGYVDKDGFLYLVDRKSDVLNPGGQLVVPSEVEAVLAEHPAVVECAVFGIRHPVLDQLVAAAVVVEETVTEVELKRFARERLSDHKVPAVIYFVASLPRNEIGKVQRSRLENLLRETGSERVRSQRGPTEQRLAGLWRSVLGLDEEPDGQANFFASGGHSLVATELAREIADALGVTPTMQGLFDHSTLTEQAAYLDTLAADPASDRTGRPELERLADGKIAPWSYLQEYMWAAKERCPNPGWNVFLTIRLSGHLDVAAVRDAITFLVRRHEILRTRLDEAGQHVDEMAAVELPMTGLTATDPSGELAEIARTQHRVCLDLRHGPALVPLLVRVAAGEHVLMLTMDHASCDGWSIGIMMRELTVAYDTLAAGGVPSLPPLPVRYRDFSAYQRDLAMAGEFDAQLDYWERQLAGLPAEPMLPRRPGVAGTPASPGYRSGLHLLAIDPELAGAVRELARSSGHTVFVILLGTLMASIRAVSGRADVVVAALSAGRHLPEVEGVVGMFANPWLLRANVAAAATYHELLDAVQTAVVGAHDHATVPFPLVAKRVGQQADRIEVWFNMAPLMSSSSSPRAGTVQAEPFSLPRNHVIEVPAAGWRGENLIVNGMDTGESMNLEFDYNIKLIEAATIDRLCATYTDILRVMTRKL